MLLITCFLSRRNFSPRASRSMSLKVVVVVVVVVVDVVIVVVVLVLVVVVVDSQWYCGYRTRPSRVRPGFASPFRLN